MTIDFATIAAISTPPGVGGIGVIRISGDRSAEIASSVFARANGTRADLRTTESHRVIFGHIHDPLSGDVIDEVLLTWMARPHSYTTEDTVEISCHGGRLPLHETLRVVLGAGARHAEPGEFTLRAFLNGRLDLSQAEAVLGVIEAQTPESLHLAIDDLRGDLSRRVQPARDAVVSLLAYLDAAADFPEDEIPGADIDADLQTATTALEEIVAGATTGMLYRDGARVVLAGRPNVGKSSLLNALLRADRAIVTPIAGTTRDVITETCNINGIPVTLSDTAGIAETGDLVEQLGVERSQRALSAADVVVLVLDGSVEPVEEDLRVAADVEALTRTGFPGRNERSLESKREDVGGSGRVVLVVNKSDLPERASQQVVFDLLAGVPVVNVSSKTGEGLSQLEEALSLALGSSETVQPAMVTVRQRAALERALAHLSDAAGTRISGFPPDLMATDVRAALRAIGEVTGENVDEAVLDEIFSRFCIGK